MMNAPGWTPRRMDRRQFLISTALGAATAPLLASCGFAGNSKSASDAALFTGWGSDTEKRNVSAAVAAFNKSRSSDKRVKYQFIANDGYDTKMNALVAANKLPALSYQNEGTAMRLGAQGHLASVLDYTDKYPAIADFLPTTIHRWASGKAVSQLAVEMYMMWYNVDALAEAKVPTPPVNSSEAWTWDQFVEYCDKLTLDASGRHPSESGFDRTKVKQYATLAPTNVNAYYPMLKSNGAEMVNPQGTDLTMDSDAAVEVMSKIHALMYEHRVAPTPTQYQSFAATFTADLLRDRHVAIVLDGQWNLLDLGQMNFKYGIGVLPKFQEPKTINLCNALAVSNNQKTIDIALQCLVFLSDPSKNDLFAKGLWIPLQKKYYTDPKAVASWIDNKVHPKGYKEAALDYLVECGEPEPAYRIKNWDQALNLFDAEWSGYFAQADGSKAKTRAVAKSAKTKVSSVLNGQYPDTKA